MRVFGFSWTFFVTLPFCSLSCQSLSQGSQRSGSVQLSFSLGDCAVVAWRMLLRLGMSDAYQKALEQFRKVSREFRLIQEQHLAGIVSDSVFLSARCALKIADLALDAAEQLERSNQKEED